MRRRLKMGEACTVVAAAAFLAGCDTTTAPVLDSAPETARPHTAAAVLPDVGDEVLVSFIAPAQQTRADIPDGTSNTILVSESLHLARDERAMGVVQFRAVGSRGPATVLVAERGTVRCLEGEPVFDMQLRPTAAPSGDTYPTETMSLNFEKVRVEPGRQGDRWLQTLRWPDGRSLTFVVRGQLVGRPPCDAVEQRLSGGLHEGR